MNFTATTGRVRHLVLFVLALAGGTPECVLSQTHDDSTDAIQTFTLNDCVAYALSHQPGLNQSLLNISVAKTTNAINLSGWLPQVSVSGNLIHYNQLPTTLIVTPGGPPVATRTGVINTAIPELSATQAIFDPQLLYSATSAHLFVEQAEQNSPGYPSSRR